MIISQLVLSFISIHAPVPFCLSACGKGKDIMINSAPSLNKDVIMYDVQNMVRVRTEPVGEKNSGIERRVGLNISDEDEELRIE
jgi:hypothetical protein